MKIFLLSSVLLVMFANGWAERPQTGPGAARASTSVSAKHPQTQTGAVHPQTQVSVLRPQTTGTVERPKTTVAVVHPKTKVSAVYPQTSVTVEHPKTTVEILHPQTTALSATSATAASAARGSGGSSSASSSAQAATSMSDFKPKQAKDLTKEDPKAPQFGGGSLALGNDTAQQGEKDALAASQVRTGQRANVENADPKNNPTAALAGLEKMLTDRTKVEQKKQ